MLLLEERGGSQPHLHRDVGGRRVVAALRDFAKVWVNMSPDNQGRFLRALIDKVVVDEDKGTCRVELIDFGAASGTKEAA